MASAGLLKVTDELESKYGMKRGTDYYWDEATGAVVNTHSGQRLTPAELTDGSSYADPSAIQDFALNSAAGGGAVAAGTRAATPAGANTYSASGDPRYRELLRTLGGAVGSDFNYDPNTDPVYGAIQQMFQGQSKEAFNAMLASQNATGIMDSSMTGDRAAEIAARTGQGLASLLPGLREQMYGERQGNIQNILSQIGLTGSLNQAGDASNLDWSQFGEGQRQFNTTFSEGQRQNNISNALALSQMFGIGVDPKSSGAALFGQVTGKPTAAVNQSLLPWSQGMTPYEKGALGQQGYGTNMSILLDLFKLMGIAPKGLEQFGVGAGTALPNLGGSGAEISDLINIWKTSGYAPQGLEQWGITKGAPLPSSNSGYNLLTPEGLQAYQSDTAQIRASVDSGTRPDEIIARLDAAVKADVITAERAKALKAFLASYQRGR